MNRICSLYGERNLIIEITSKRKSLYEPPVKIMLEEYKTKGFNTKIQILPDLEYSRTRDIDYFRTVSGFDRRNIYEYSDAHEIYGYPYENLFPKRASKSEDYIAVWHPKHNLTDPQEWKNPIGYKGIINYVESLNQEIKYVDYTMDLRYIIDTIANAKLCIGYEGMGQLISQSFMKPIITFSTRDYISLYNSGPWGLVVDKIYDHMFDVDNIIGTQNEKIDKYRSCSN
jgi:hypothetical protein